MDGMLSQDEINALLSGINLDDEASNKSSGEELTLEEKDAIGEISNISMGTAATTLSSLVNQRVVITTPVVEYATWNDIIDINDRPCVFIQIYYDEGIDGNNILMLKENDVKIIADLMMGGDGLNVDQELTDLHLSAIGEAMNQMMGSAATSMSSMLNARISISPPDASVVAMDETALYSDNFPEFLRGTFVMVSFRMEIGDLVDSVLMQLYPFDFARALYEKFTGVAEEEEPMKENTAEQNINNQQSQPVDHSTMQQPHLQQGYSQQEAPQMPPTGFYGNNMGQSQGTMPEVSPYTMPQMQNVNARPVQFAAFTPENTQVHTPENIGLLMDVPLEVTVELGRTSRSIKEILDFTPGTIIELDRLAGEPIDVLVNGKLVAKGEVVVMEETFGIRLTDIIKN